MRNHEHIQNDPAHSDRGWKQLQRIHGLDAVAAEPRAAEGYSVISVLDLLSDCWMLFVLTAV